MRFYSLVNLLSVVGAGPGGAHGVGHVFGDPIPWYWWCFVAVGLAVIAYRLVRNFGWPWDWWWGK
jgi:hypothetical protein